jgi:hypothetical protein
MKTDVCFISDSLSKKHYKMNVNAFGDFYDSNHGKPMFIEFDEHSSNVLIPLNSLPSNYLTRQGIIKARVQFLQALKYSVEKLGAEVVLLAASTKRLFGKEANIRINDEGYPDKNGFTLQELYSDIFFTNGDNGTAIILNKEIDNILSNVSQNHKDNSVLINGLGFLGTDALKHIIEKHKYLNKIYVISKYSMELSEIIAENHIRVYDSITNITQKDAQNISAIINCTHNPDSLITSDVINYFQNGQTVHVIDVAVPYGFPEEEFMKCKNVSRQDGGNAYIAEGLEFYFNPEICGLTDNVLYGCFAEAMCIGAYLKEYPNQKENLKDYDWFNVNDRTKEFVRKLFQKYNVTTAPVPYNYMKRDFIK